MEGTTTTLAPWEWQCIWTLAVSQALEPDDLDTAVPLAVEIWLARRDMLRSGFRSLANTAEVTLNDDGSASVIYRSTGSSPES